MPGCGKSTIGELISKDLNYNFYDMDDYIVKISGKTIKELFDVSEEYFREWETKACKELSKLTNVIIASGGGVVTVSYTHLDVYKRQEQIVSIAQEVKKSGANFLRGGAFKPRTSPYSFQGLKYEGLELLKIAKEKTGLPIVTELMSPYDIEKFVEDVDVIQVGARNMQNFDLLKELGKTNKTILLKRGLSATIEEWLMSAEYIMAGGNENIVLCERGIRTFETYTRNTLDLSAIPAVKKLSH